MEEEKKVVGEERGGRRSGSLTLDVMSKTADPSLPVLAMVAPRTLVSLCLDFIFSIVFLSNWLFSETYE